MATTAWSIVLLPLMVLLVPLVNSGWTTRGKNQLLLLALSLPLLTLLCMLVIKLLNLISSSSGFVISFWGGLLFLCFQWLPICWAVVLLSQPALQERLLNYLRSLPGLKRRESPLNAGAT